MCSFVPSQLQSNANTMCMCWVRHQIVLWTLLTCACLFANVLVFNFASIALTKDESIVRLEPVPIGEHTRVRRDANATEVDVDVASDVNRTFIDEVATTFSSSTTTTTTTMQPTTMSTTSTTSESTTTSTTTTSVVLTTTDRIEPHERPSGLEHEITAWQIHQQLMLNVIVALAMLLPLPLLYWIVHAFGARYAAAVALLASAVATSGVWPGRHSLTLLFVLRGLQGACLSLTMPLISLVLTNWASIKNRPVFLAYMLAFVPLGAFLCNTLSGILHYTVLDIQYSFYAHSVLSAVVAVLFFWQYRDMPQWHPRITGVELDRILSGKGVANRPKPVEFKTVPWRKILKSTHVSVLLLTTFCHYAVLFFACFYAPWFIHAFNEETDSEVAGLQSLIPFFLHMVTTVVFALSALKYKEVNDTRRTRIFSGIAFGGAVLFTIVALACMFADADGSKAYIVGAFLLVVMILGANGGGFYRGICTLSRQHAHTVVLFMAIVMCVSMIFVHVLLVLSDSWKLTFIVLLILELAGLAIYCFVGSAERAKWTQVPTRDGTTDFDNNVEENGDMEAGILEMRVIDKSEMVTIPH